MENKENQINPENRQESNKNENQLHQIQNNQNSNQQISFKKPNERIKTKVIN